MQRSIILAMVEGHNDRLRRLLPHGQARDRIFSPRMGFFLPDVCFYFFLGVGWRPGGSRKVFFFSVGIPLGRVYRSRSEGNGQIVYNSEICHNFNYQGLVYRHRQIDSDRRMDHRGSAARAWKMRSETECQDLATPQSNQSWHAFWDSYVDVIIVSPGGTGTFLFF